MAVCPTCAGSMISFGLLLSGLVMIGILLPLLLLLLLVAVLASLLPGFHQPVFFTIFPPVLPLSPHYSFIPSLPYLTSPVH